MKKSRHTKKKLTDEEIELFCQSVEDVLTQIKIRSESKKSKKPKKKDLIISEKEINALEEEIEHLNN
jgi:tRNA C32,U32 (ribose-2'-O)-methylase TrmJ